MKYEIIKFNSNYYVRVERTSYDVGNGRYKTTYWEWLVGVDPDGYTTTSSSKEAATFCTLEAAKKGITTSRNLVAGTSIEEVGRL